MIRVREERPGDVAAIRAVNDAAFGRPTEGAIVDALRASCERIVSLVAIEDDAIVGHILFSPVELERTDSGSAEASSSPAFVHTGMGLGPMAVSPAHQRRGVGSMLVRDGLDRMRDGGVPFVVVLGHPEYYPRFGFERASIFGVRCPWDVPDDVFMLIVFESKTMPAFGGVVHYREEFDTAI